jgi:hypothetical protein
MRWFANLATANCPRAYERCRLRKSRAGGRLSPLLQGTWATNRRRIIHVLPTRFPVCFEPASGIFPRQASTDLRKAK